MDPALIAETWDKVDAYYEARSYDSGRRRQKIATHVESASLSRSMSASKPRVDPPDGAPGADYTGPRLEFPLTADMMRALVMYYARSTGVPLHSHYVAKVLSEARIKYATAPRVTRIQGTPPLCLYTSALGSRAGGF